MQLFEQLMAALPELTEYDFRPSTGTIVLRDDADGEGVYIAKWNHLSPIPDGFKLGK